MAEVRLEQPVLESVIARVLSAVGLAAADAAAVAEALVDADAAGHPTHGTFLVPMYVRQLQTGAATVASRASVVVETSTNATLDASGMLGVLSGRQAMAMAIEKAAVAAIGCVAVRHAFHFGMAGLFARQAADAGVIGIAASNTRPLMPAPGGTEVVVGNNPLAIAVPDPDGRHLVIDMALSAASLGAIRQAAAEDDIIPVDWAVDSSGRPTREATSALTGMLLPAAGAKGFGLAVIVEVLTGALAQGAVTSDVRGLYAEPLRPQDSSQFFLAIDPAAFGDREGFAERVGLIRDRIHAVPTVDGAPSPVPGDRSAVARERSRLHGIVLPESTYVALRDCAASVGVEMAGAE